MNPCKSRQCAVSCSSSPFHTVLSQLCWQLIVALQAHFHLISELSSHATRQPAKNLLLATLLSETFAMDCPVTTDGDYISSQVTGFPTDEDDHSQRVGGLASMPLTNGVRYHAPQSAMQDLQYVIFPFFFPFLCSSFNLDCPCAPLGPL